MSAIRISALSVERLRQTWLFQFLIIILFWLAIWQLGRLSELTTHASVWFPAAGFTYASLLIFSFRAVAPLVISCVLITLWAGDHYQIPLAFGELVFAGLAFSIAHITPYFLASHLMRYLTNRVRVAIPLLIAMFLITSAFASLMAMVTGMIALVGTNMMAQEDIAGAWLAYWIGDFAGVVVLGPLFTAWLIWLCKSTSFNVQQYGLVAPFRAHSSYFIKVVSNTLLIVITMMFVKAIGTQEAAFAIFFLAVTHMWIACSESPVANITSLALSSFLIALLVNLLALEAHVMVYQFAIIVVAANALFGIALPSLAADNYFLRNQIIRDSLTSAASRQYLFQRADATILDCMNKHTPLSILVFDIDHFKAINDQFGHQEGDAALIRITESVNEHLRPTDLLARYGGDEFVVLLPGTDEKAAMAIAQRIRSSANLLTVKGQSVSVSLGGTALQHDDTFTTMFARADRALYRAKASGRNRVGFSLFNASTNEDAIQISPEIAGGNE